MTPHAHLCLVLHNHQPIGNFDGVFEQAYQDSYLPFLEVFEPYEQLQISLHTSGPLMMWMADRHPEYLDRIRMLGRRRPYRDRRRSAVRTDSDDACPVEIGLARSKVTGRGCRRNLGCTPKRHVDA